MDRILIILKKENGPRASSALTLGLNTIILKHVYWYKYMQQISGERLQDHWSSGLIILLKTYILTSTHNVCFESKLSKLGIPLQTPV